MRLPLGLLTLAVAWSLSAQEPTRDPAVLKAWLGKASEVLAACVPGTAELTTLPEWTITFQYIPEPTPEYPTYVSCWFTPTPYTPSQAARSLALPSYNQAIQVRIALIPAGTQVLRGVAGSMVGRPGFPEGATGGGIQFYLQHPERVLYLKSLEDARSTAEYLNRGLCCVKVSRPAEGR